MRKKLFTISQAAEQIGCHRSTALRQAEKLGLGFQVSREILVTEAEIKKLAKVIKPRPASRKKK